MIFNLKLNIFIFSLEISKYREQIVPTQIFSKRKKTRFSHIVADTIVIQLYQHNKIHKYFILNEG